MISAGHFSWPRIAWELDTWSEYLRGLCHHLVLQCRAGGVTRHLTQLCASHRYSRKTNCLGTTAFPSKNDGKWAEHRPEIHTRSLWVKPQGFLRGRKEGSWCLLRTWEVLGWRRSEGTLHIFSLLHIPTNIIHCWGTEQSRWAVPDLTSLLFPNPHTPETFFPFLKIICMWIKREKDR